MEAQGTVSINVQVSMSGGGGMKRVRDFRTSISIIFILLVGMAMTGCGTALTQAAKEGDIAAIQKLLDQGANINESGSRGGVMAGSPLSYAAYHCRIEAVKYLIQKGADINNATGYTSYGDSGGGLRPLHMAASSGCTEAIKLLLDAGADICRLAFEGGRVRYRSAKRFCLYTSDRRVSPFERRKL